MSQAPFDPKARLRYADEALSTAAEQLLALLKEAALELRPFPPFPGAFFSFGVEVEPPGTLDSSLGCIVVTEDGDLRELQISFDAQGPDGFGGGDPVSMREESLVEVEMNPYDRLLFAHGGLTAITELLRERAADADGQHGQDGEVGTGPDSRQT